MNVGFESFNQKGFKIIGTDYANLVHYGTKTLTVFGGQYLVTAAGQRIYWDAYAAIPDDGSVIRFYRADFPVVEQGGVVRAPTGNIGGSIICYSFGPVVKSNAGEGVEVYGSTGDLTFNTAKPFLKLVGVYADGRASLLGFKYGFSYPAQATGLKAPKVAWSVGNARYIYLQQQFSNGSTDSFEYILGCRVDDAGVYSNYAMQYGATIRRSGWNGTYDHVPPTGAIRILVADVSGL
ncbi:hypothetical protein ACIPIX_06385 [Pseudomonas protegens]|uniref:hypothetical protein n=1 Tax=Pseudomonas protegens TaxID=380021 RepID=UPI00380B73BB